MNLEVSVSKNKKGIFHSNNGGYLHFDVIVLNRLIFYHESIEILQLLLRLGTFQLSDIFYNTVGGVLGGLMYCAVMKVRKRL